MTAPWLAEFNKFTPQAIAEIKANTDDTHTEREWMAYVYEKGGRYHIGNASMGDRSKIEVVPATKQAQDTLTRGLTANQRQWTIHSHPLKDGKIYTGRQFFSSTDIIDEFLETRDTNERIVQFLVFPHGQNDGQFNPKGQAVTLHNRLRVLVFPDSKTIIAAMKRSNPHVDPMTITKENGQNKTVNEKTTQNDLGIDWFTFQEALGDMGYMGIVDLEGAARSVEPFSMAAESDTSFNNFHKVAIGAVAIAAIFAVVGWMHLQPGEIS